MANDESEGARLVWIDELRRCGFCSRMCADQPATREQANIAGARAAGSPR